MKITGETSDGYHTFNELYYHRMLLCAALFNTFYEQTATRAGSWAWGVHKSWQHYAGGDEMFPGMFVVMCNLPTGQISYHYDAEHWDLFKIPQRDRADTWDGHTPDDVAERLARFLRGEY